MRTKNAIYNILATWVGQCLLIFVTLVSRKVFLQNLGADYLGVDGLFANILSFLSMAELGIGSAITYSLYKPLALIDVDSMKSLMKLYKISYCIIGALIFIAGTILTPFLPYIVSNSSGLNNVTLIYFLFLFNTSVSYFFSYKSALIIADQKKYIFNINHYTWKITLCAAQIFVIIKSQNYLAYLALQVVSTILENYTIARIADKRYPWLKEKSTKKVPKETIAEIKKNTASMMLNKVGTTLVTSTDSVLISSFISVAAVGIYGNYTTISKAVENVLYQGMYAMTASIGNLNVCGSRERKFQVFKTISFVIVWIYGFGCIALFGLLTPFVELWYGTNMQISTFAVFLLCMNLYIAGQMTTLNMQIEAGGLYWHVKFLGIVEAVSNLFFSAVLGRAWGLEGILAGTVLGSMSYTFWAKTKVVLKLGHKKQMQTYLIQLLKDTIVVIFAGFVTVLLLGNVKTEGYNGFLLKLILVVVIPNIILWFCFRRRKEFLEVKRMLLSYLKRD